MCVFSNKWFKISVQPAQVSDVVYFPHSDVARGVAQAWFPGGDRWVFCRLGSDQNFLPKGLKFSILRIPVFPFLRRIQTKLFDK